MDMDVVITSNKDSDDLWAEISYDNYYWAEIRWEAAQGEFITTIYAPLDGSDRYVFSLLDLQAALEHARQRLLELGYGGASQTRLD